MDCDDAILTVETDAFRMRAAHHMESKSRVELRRAIADVHADSAAVLNAVYLGAPMSVPEITAYAVATGVSLDWLLGIGCPMIADGKVARQNAALAKVLNLHGYVKRERRNLFRSALISMIISLAVILAMLSLRFADISGVVAVAAVIPALSTACVAWRYTRELSPKAQCKYRRALHAELIESTTALC